MRLCLNMIVRNEADRIIRALQSAVPHISCAVITDTGSTDGTPDLIKDFFTTVGIPCTLTHCKFKDFSQARNAAFFAAQHSAYEFDYLLLMDADMELKVVDPTWTDTLAGAQSYDMMQVAGALHYQNRRFAKRGMTQGYVGVTHEYLNLETGGSVPAEKAYFIDYADGSNRADKFKRDIKLLKEGLEKEPKNERYFYYLAQSYRDAGKPEKAIKWYQRRIAAGGWDEEVWSAEYMMAHCYKDMGDTDKFIQTLISAYNKRPSRAEPLYDLAHWYRDRGENAAGLLFAETGIQIPSSKDSLFVNDFVYNVGCLEEYSIMAFYVPGKKLAGYKVANMLTLKKTPYTGARETARRNMFHYYEPLKTLCPSFDWKPIAFAPPKDYVAMNPSIAWHGDKLKGVIRTVNYRIDEQGRYLIRGTDGTCNSTNPIHTRNFLVEFDVDLNVVPDTRFSPSTLGTEIRIPVDLPKPLFDLVIGFEDCRLYQGLGTTGAKKLWVSATLRELTAEGACEQVRAQVVHYTPLQGEPFTILEDMTRMKRRGHEKNWMPIIGAPSHRFMYRADEVVDGAGETVVKHDAPIDVSALAGSSQLVPVKDGYLAVVHEASQIPGQPTRWYSHRFVAFDNEFKIKKVTPPFYLNEKGIEYVAGLAITPDSEKLILSYGFKDCEARIATITVKEVELLLWAS